MNARDRKYVAMVSRKNADKKVYFSAFKLPTRIKNDIKYATEYFYNEHIKPFSDARLEKVITAENYWDLRGSFSDFWNK